MLRLKRNKHSFELNCVYVTEAARRALTRETISDALRRHQQGDWGSVDRKTRKYNDANLKLGDGELVSNFEDAFGTRFSVNTTRFHASATVSLLGEPT